MRNLPQPHQDVLNACRRQGRFIVGYAGAHGLANALDGVLNAARIMAGQPVDFVLVG